MDFPISKDISGMILEASRFDIFPEIPNKMIDCLSGAKKECLFFPMISRWIVFNPPSKQSTTASITFPDGMIKLTPYERLNNDFDKDYFAIRTFDATGKVLDKFWWKFDTKREDLKSLTFSEYVPGRRNRHKKIHTF